MGPYHTSRFAEFPKFARRFCQGFPRLGPVLLASLAVAGCSAFGFTPGTVTLNAGTSTHVNVTLTPPPSSALPVSLTASNSNVALGGQAPGAGDTVTMPAGQSTVAETITGTLAGTTTVTATATPTQVLTSYKDGTLTVAVAPVLSDISPGNAAIGAPVTFSGAGFVAGATAIFTPTQGQPALPPVPAQYQSASTLTAPLPQGIGGTYNVLVQANGQSSNTVPYTAAGYAGPRQSGAFTEFSGNVVSSLAPPPTCSTGAATLKVVLLDPNDPMPSLYQATYTNTQSGQQIGLPIKFNSTSLGANPVVDGGAGFDPACKVGVILDAQGGGQQGSQQRFRFLDLATGSEFPAYSFASSNSFYPPRLFDSPDGTIILAVTSAPSNTTALSAIFVDVVNGGSQFGAQTQSIPAGSPPVAASVEISGFAIDLTLGSPLPNPIPIPPP